MKNILGKIFTFLLFFVFYSISLNATSSFKLNISKDKVYVGEPIYVTLTLKYDLESPIISTDFDEFISPNFWIKEIAQSDPIKDGNITSITYKFLIFPQIVGDLKIDSQHLRIANREAKTNLIIWSDIHTKQKNIKVLALPKDIKILGNYTLNVKIDKKEININEPINLTLTLKGNGNLDDIKAFKLDFQDVLIFSSKPIVNGVLKDVKYVGEFSQKFSLISDKDFIIPPIEFKYFNTDTKLVEIIKSKSFNIKVKINKHELNNINKNTKYIYGIVGFFIGILIILIFLYLNKIVKNREKKDELDLYTKIKKAKNDKQLYSLLLPYCKEYDLSDVMRKLEDNIYHDGKNKIKKKNIL